MPVAFVLIETEIGKIGEVLDKLQSLEEVVEAFSVAGPYSIVARIEAKSFEDLSKIVPQKIQGIKGITRTLTLLAFGTARTFRVDACERAQELERAAKFEELYNLCRGCRQLKLCAFGARVITYGL
jgi:DNA-binding Lrp family transcriptional regulator